MAEAKVSSAARRRIPSRSIVSGRARRGNHAQALVLQFHQRRGLAMASISGTMRSAFVLDHLAWRVPSIMWIT